MYLKTCKNSSLKRKYRAKQLDSPNIVNKLHEYISPQNPCSPNLNLDNRRLLHRANRSQKSLKSIIVKDLRNITEKIGKKTIKIGKNHGFSNFIK